LYHFFAAKWQCITWKSVDEEEPATLGGRYGRRGSMSAEGAVMAPSSIAKTTVDSAALQVNSKALIEVSGTPGAGSVEALGRLWQSRDVVTVFMFLLGSIIGSFLNVCIVRIPEEFSIVLPGSRCPKCQTAIHWYDNVPVFAWFWLGGKCRTCHARISPMYPLVEAATALLFVACYLRFGLTPLLVKWLVFTSLLIVLSITDLRVRMLPDLVNWPGVVAGLILSAVAPPNDGTAAWLSYSIVRSIPSPRVLGLFDGLLGAAFGSVLLWGVAELYKRVRGREGMGFGDVKMMVMVGAFLGVRGTFLTILLGTLLGSLIGAGTILALYAMGWHRALAERASRRGIGTLETLRWAIASQYQLPLGTFLGIAAMVVVYFGPHMLERWAELVRPV
jgi:leader peptidase (prepilin peptidase) / N-methyltransferase